MRPLEELYDVDDSSFVDNIIKEIRSHNLEDLFVGEEGEEVRRYEIFVHTISSCGVSQSREVAEFFDMKTLLNSFSIIEDHDVDKNSKKYDRAQNMVDFTWDYIDKHASDMSDQLNNKIKIPGYDGWFYFGYLEADGSYGLFYTWEVSDTDKCS